MTDTDRRAHPWPPEGDAVELRLRRAVWAAPRPVYEAKGAQYELADLVRLTIWRGWFPFLTVRTRLVHFYIGWRPVTMDDPAFYWRDLRAVDALRRAGALFVQFGIRWGVGAIS